MLCVPLVLISFLWKFILRKGNAKEKSVQKKRDECTSVSETVSLGLTYEVPDAVINSFNHLSCKPLRLFKCEGVPATCQKKKLHGTLKCFVEDVEWAVSSIQPENNKELEKTGQNETLANNLHKEPDSGALGESLQVQKKTEYICAAGSEDDQRGSSDLFSNSDQSDSLCSSGSDYSPSSDESIVSDNISCQIERRASPQDGCINFCVPSHVTVDNEHVSDSESECSVIIPYQGLEGLVFKEKNLTSPNVLNNSIDSSDSEDEFEENIVRALDNPAIYIKKVMKSETTSKGSKKRSDRVYNSYQFCGFCKKLVSNFSQHLERIHSAETELKNTDMDHKNSLNLLRGKFNNQFNMMTLAKGKGEILLERRPSQQWELKNYGPCIYCFHWLNKRLFLKHQASCPGVKNESVVTVTTSELVTRSDILSERLGTTASQKLVDEVFTKMNMDDVGRTARGDALIVQLGNQHIENNIGNVLKRAKYASEGMRLTSRLLLNIQNLLPDVDNDLYGFLRPSYFETLMEAAILTASPIASSDKQSMKSPSAALKLSYHLKSLIDGKIGLAIMKKHKSNNDEEKKRFQNDANDAEELEKLIKIYWKGKVSTPSRVTLAEKQFNKHTRLPKPDDIEMLNKYLMNTIAEIDLNKIDAENFQFIAELIEAKLLIYNRRRSGELEALRIDEYKKRSTGASTIQNMQLTKLERELLSSQDVVTIRGKVGKGVPVIFPDVTKGPMEFLVDPEVRKVAGINENNPYVFACQGQKVIRAYTSLKNICAQINLSDSSTITSTNLRKYMATVVQCLDLKDHQMEWVVKHMGHTLNVHKIHYRSTSDVLERTQIAKILLLQDHNISNFKDKSLDDIALEDIVLNSHKSKSTTKEVEDTFDPHVIEGACHEETTTQSSRGNVSGNQVHTSKKPKWSLEEETEIKLLFKEFFQKKIRPSPDDCLKAIKKSKANKGLIQHRKKDVLKKKLFRMIDKLK